MSHRFFHPETAAETDRLVLTGSEAHHAVDVLRLRTGDALEVFDGTGAARPATIGAMRRDAVELDAGPVRRRAAPACRILLAQAIPKGKTMDLVVQKATELGAAAILPLLTERTVVRFDSAADAAAKRGKWQRVALEACKQCGQDLLPSVALPATLGEVLAGTAADLALVASLQPGALHLKSLLAAFTASHGRPPASVLLLIGPEGDFTPGEIAVALAAGARPMTLGPVVLRAETAAIYGLSVLAHELLG